MNYKLFDNNINFENNDDKLNMELNKNNIQ